MTERPIITRAVPLIDLDIAKDGRTVTAYAATFDDPYEVRDQHGHYIESIERTAFNRTLGRGIERVVPLFNHGLTIYGTPSEKDSDPLGVPLAIRAETRGLLTVTRFGTTPRAEEVLTMLKDGTVTSYSFQGPIVRSTTASHTSGLRHLVRTELGLKDYGPGVLAVNRNAAVLAIRTAALLEEIEQLTPEARGELLAKLSPPPAGDPPALDPESTDPQGNPADDLSASDPDPSTDPTILAALNAQRRRR
jgi:HK97 family phage prohead protease